MPKNRLFASKHLCGVCLVDPCRCHEMSLEEELEASADCLERGIGYATFSDLMREAASELRSRSLGGAK